MGGRRSRKPISRVELTAFLVPGKGRTVIQYRRNQVVFSQGEPADAVFYLQRGRIKLVVVDDQGREAIIAIVEPGDFFGSRCLAGQPLRLGTAVAMTESSLLRIDTDSMLRTLHEEPAFCALFMTYLLSRKMRLEEDLIDHLVNGAEKRLARALLLLAHYGDQGRRDVVIPKISQETLAEMVGTTRSRVSVFMSKFRKLGLIDVGRDELKIHGSLLNIALHD